MQKRGKLVLILLVLCVMITVIPLILIKDSEFGGADGAAEEIITEIKPDYEPWAASLIAPPGGETESLLFCLQAGIGCIILGYGFGYLVARKKYA
ncbi:energy-coupling factor ABC transporter substrate-binding protein [Clostridium sp. Marseille-P299]|uniref:energy-coupling factor ABC transporter substrate-binding protein n=1 Tax=Clostridium sp. Marseille-P299 TaxID=1805477 RepID=UPI00082F0F45|nr:energy-coupling factor ABC transporter substrate-binding protein [Clostridium sp. Marseille-P299]